MLVDFTMTFSLIILKSRDYGYQFWKKIIVT